MTDIDTAAIEARLAADTAPTWHVCDDDATQVRDVFGRLVASAEGVDEADLIAHAPTDLRNLLDRLAAVEAERDEAMARLAAVREVAAAWASDQSSGVKVHCGRKLRDALDGER